MKSSMKRRGLRYSVALVMVSITIAAFLAMVANRVVNAELARRSLIREINVNGGQVTYDNSLRTLFRSQRVVNVWLPEQPTLSAKQISILPHVKDVGLPGVLQTDLGLAGRLSVPLSDLDRWQTGQGLFPRRPDSSTEAR